MKFKLALLAAAGSIAMVSGASAQEYYGTLGIGLVDNEDSNDFEDTGSAFPASFVTDYDLDSGIAVYGGVGRYFANGFRGEIELSNRSQNVDELKGDGLGFAGFPLVDGELSATALMGNLYLDFAASERVTPFVGVGLGIARLRPDVDNISTVSQPALNANEQYRVVVADKDFAPAAQVMAGLGIDLTDNVMMDVKYRFLAAGEFEYGGYINDQFTNLESEFRSQELSLGLRFNAGAAAAPAPVAQTAPVVEYKDCWDGSRVVVTAECPPEIMDEVIAPEELDLTVYFDYDKSNLTSAAESLIAAKAAEAKEYDISSVSVSGNTDTSGSSAYNQALSARRANVVRDALVQNGIDASVISVEALGETNPAKPTEDGVREPLNRRTEVQFEF